MSLNKFKKLASPVIHIGGLIAASGLILYATEYKLQQEHARKVALYQSQNYEVCSDNPDLYMKISEPQSVTIRDTKGSTSDSTKIDFKDLAKDVSLVEQKQAAENFRKAKIQPL